MSIQRALVQLGTPSAASKAKSKAKLAYYRAPFQEPLDHRIHKKVGLTQVPACRFK